MNGQLIGSTRMMSIGKIRQASAIRSIDSTWDPYSNSKWTFSIEYFGSYPREDVGEVRIEMESGEIILHQVETIDLALDGCWTGICKKVDY